MRISLIAGAILAGAGLFMILRPPSYTTEERLIKMGEIEATVQRDRPVPGWIGGIAVGAGIVLLVTGWTRRP